MVVGPRCSNSSDPIVGLSSHFSHPDPVVSLSSHSSRSDPVVGLSFHSSHPDPVVGLSLHSSHLDPVIGLSSHSSHPDPVVDHMTYCYITVNVFPCGIPDDYCHCLISALFWTVVCMKSTLVTPILGSNWF